MSFLYKSLRVELAQVLPSAICETKKKKKKQRQSGQVLHFKRTSPHSESIVQWTYYL